MSLQDITVWNQRFFAFMHDDGTWVLREYDAGGERHVATYVDVSRSDPWASQAEARNPRPGWQAPGAAASRRRDSAGRRGRDSMDAGKSFARTLTSGEDRLTFVAEQKKSSVRVFAEYIEREVKDGKKVITRGPERGASTEHPDMDAAKKFIEEEVAKQVAAGWAISAGRVGFERKPAAFDLTNIPKPRTVAAPAPAAEGKKGGKK